MPNPTLYDNFNQVRQYIDQNQVDLSSYVSKSELEGMSYATTSDLSNYVLAPTVVSDPTEPYKMFATGLGANNQWHHFYPLAKTYTEAVSLNANAWASVGTVRNYVEGRIAEIEASYVTSADLPVIDENIIPKETATYTLGDSSYMYNATYTNTINFSSTNSITNINTGQLTMKLNNSNTFMFHKDFFAPNTSNVKNLGTSNLKWGATYITNIYTENVSYTSGKSSIKMNDRNVDIWANDKKMVNVSDYNGVVPTQTNVNLGGSSNKWAATYTNNLYAPTAYSTYIVGPQGHINLNGDTQAPFILSYDVSGTTTKLMQLAYRYAGNNYKGWKFAPIVNEGINLGSYNSHGVTQWGSTYTKSLYLDGTPIQSIINSLFSYDTATGTLTITTL